MPPFPIDPTLWNSMSARGPYDSAFAPNPMNSGPVGPQGYGFGSQSGGGTMMERSPGTMSNMPVYDPSVGQQFPGSILAAQQQGQQPGMLGQLSPAALMLMMRLRGMQQPGPVRGPVQGPQLPPGAAPTPGVQGMAPYPMDPNRQFAPSGLPTASIAGVRG